MPQLGDFLNRFRPAGAPGAATRAGVPADREAELSAELGPVLAMLEGADAECVRLAAEARREADRTVADAREEAASISAYSARQAEEARAEAAAEVLASARESARQAERAAVAQAGLRPRPDEAAVQALIRDAVAMVRAASLAGPGGTGPGRTGPGGTGET